MASIGDKIQLGRTTNVYVTQETTAGTMVYPSAGSGNVVIPSGAPDFNQQPSYTNSTEIRNSRSLTTRFVDQNPAGTWSLPCYCRPSGTAGSIPDGHILLYAAFGSTTTYAGSSVTYTLSDDDHLSMSIFMQMSDMVFALVGCTVNEFRATFANKGGINFNFSGGFMTMKWCGKAPLEGESAAVFTVSADDAKMFCTGMKIKIWDDSLGTYDDNSSAGYQISAVGSTSVTVTPDPSTYTYASGDWIEPWLPTATEIGDAIEARTGTCRFEGTGASAVPIISADVALTNNIKYSEEEISTAVYPTSFVADMRAVTCDTTLFLRRDDLHYFKDSGLLASADKVQADLVLRGGDASGQYVQIQMPQAEGSVPNLSGDLEKQISINYAALGTTSYNDEIKLTFY